MKLIDSNHGFEGHLPSNTVAFKIETSAKLFGILSSGIYEDKILAPIRELACNAFDAHIAAGNRNTPFIVKLPNFLDATFSITDQGTGIDPTKIGDIFWTYGASTKAESNEYVGALGLGSKSPFAYTKSSFMVKNRYKGVEHHYLCFLNDKGTPDGAILAEVPATEPDGVTIEFAVRQGDITEFQARAKKFFTTWTDVMPIFKGETHFKVPVLKKVVEGRDWYLREYTNFIGTTAIALMGNVPYPINADNIPNLPDGLDHIFNNPFVIKVPMGDLNFAASREGLEYDERTCAALIKYGNLIRDEVVKDFHDKIFASKTLIEFIHAFRTEFIKFKSSFVLTGADDEDYLHVLFGKSGDETIKFGDEEYSLGDLIASRFVRTVPGITPFGLYEIQTRGTSLKLTPLSVIQMEALEDFEVKATYTTTGHRSGVVSDVEVDIDFCKGGSTSYNWTVPKHKKYRSYSAAEMMTRLLQAQNDPKRISSETRTTFTVTDPKNVMIIINDLGAVGNARAAAYINKNKATNGQFFYSQNPDVKENFAHIIQSTTDWAGAAKFGIDVKLISELPDEREKVEVDADAREIIKVPVSIWEMTPNGAHVPKGAQPVLYFARTSGFGRDVNIHTRHPFKLSELKAKPIVYYTLRDRSKSVLEKSGEAFALTNHDMIEFIRDEKLYTHLLDENGKLTVLNLTESEASGLIKRGIKLASVLETIKPAIVALAEKEQVWEKFHDYRALYNSESYLELSGWLERHRTLSKFLHPNAPLQKVFAAIKEKDANEHIHNKIINRAHLFGKFMNGDAYKKKQKKWNFIQMKTYPLVAIILKGGFRETNNEYKLIAEYINKVDLEMGYINGDEISEIFESNVFFSTDL